MAGVIVIETSLVIATITVTAAIVVLVSLLVATKSGKKEEVMGYGPALEEEPSEEKRKEEEFLALFNRIGRYSDSKTLGRKFTKWFGQKVRQDLGLVSGNGIADTAYGLWTISANKALAEYLGPEGIRKCLGFGADDTEGIMEVCEVLDTAVRHVAKRLRESIGSEEERANMAETEFYPHEMERVPFECREAFVRPEDWIAVNEDNPHLPTEDGDLILVTRDEDMGCSYSSVACIYLGEQKQFGTLFGEVLPVYWEGEGYYGIEPARSGEKNTDEETLMVGPEGPVLRLMYDGTSNIIAWSRLKPYLPEIFR